MERKTCKEPDCKKCMLQFGYTIMWFCPRGKVKL